MWYEEEEKEEEKEGEKEGEEEGNGDERDADCTMRWEGGGDDDDRPDLLRYLRQ